MIWFSCNQFRLVRNICQQISLKLFFKVDFTFNPKDLLNVLIVKVFHSISPIRHKYSFLSVMILHKIYIAMHYSQLSLKINENNANP